MRKVSSIWLPVTLKDRLDEIAKDEGRTFTNLVIYILRQFVQKQDRLAGREENDYVE